MKCRNCGTDIIMIETIKKLYKPNNKGELSLVDETLSRLLTCRNYHANYNIGHILELNDHDEYYVIKAP